MYSRGNYNDAPTDVITVPPNYSGSTFSGGSGEETKAFEVESGNKEATSPKDIESNSETEKVGLFGNIGNIFGGFTGLKGGIGEKIRSIDTEDILLIGLALFLFFSKDGDKECALMLIFLLFLS